jgi:hypothetical protein
MSAPIPLGPTLPTTIKIFMCPFYVTNISFLIIFYFPWVFSPPEYRGVIAYRTKLLKMMFKVAFFIKNQLYNNTI